MLPGDCAFWETDETEPFFFNDGANYPQEGVKRPAPARRRSSLV